MTEPTSAGNSAFIKALMGQVIDQSRALDKFIWLQEEAIVSAAADLESQLAAVTAERDGLKADVRNARAAHQEAREELASKPDHPSDAERWLREQCAKFNGTPIDKQSLALADIAIAMDLHIDALTAERDKWRDDHAAVLAERDALRGELADKKYMDGIVDGLYRDLAAQAKKAGELRDALIDIENEFEVQAEDPLNSDWAGRAALMVEIARDALKAAPAPEEPEIPCEMCDGEGVLPPCGEQCTLGPNGGYCPGEGGCRTEGACPEYEDEPAEEPEEEPDVGEIRPDPAPRIPEEDGSGAPAPAAPTGPTTSTGELSYIPPVSSSGISPNMQMGAAKFLHLTRNSDGSELRGASFVMYAADDLRFTIEPDPHATDGPVKGTIRWRVAHEIDPFSVDRGWSKESLLMKAALKTADPPLWPAANGPITIADLGEPLLDANGSKWWRVEAAEDRTTHDPNINKSHSSGAATVFFVCVLAAGQTAPRPPAVGYHATQPIAPGTGKVEPIVFVRDTDTPSWLNEKSHPCLWRDEAHLDQIIDRKNTTTAWRQWWSNAQRNLSDHRRQPPYFIERITGKHLSSESMAKEQWSLLVSALTAKLEPGDVSALGFTRDATLHSGLVAHELALGEHHDYTALGGGKGYDFAEQAISVALSFAWHRGTGLWTVSEEARIRDALARYVWTSLLRHRNPYGRWIDSNGYCRAMWETARDQASAVISLVLPDYVSRQYGHSDAWNYFFVEGGLAADEDGEWYPVTSKSGLFGLLNNKPEWTDKNGRYFYSHLCAGLFGLTASILANAGEPVPAHWEGALILAINGKLPGAGGRVWWTPLMCNSHFPVYLSIVKSLHGKQAILDAAVATRGERKDDPDSMPGGMGAGAGVLGICLTEVV